MTSTTTTPTPVVIVGTSPARRSAGARRRGRRWPLTVAGYLVALLFLLPYAEMVVSALRPANELLDRNYLPRHFDWSNFTSLWRNGFGQNLAASLEVAAGSTALVLVVALPAAYYTARRRSRGRTLSLLLVLATQMFQPAAMLVGIQREFTSFDLPSPIMSLILVNSGFNLAFAVWILNAYFASIPPDLEEAAMVDGTSRFGAVRRITLPLTMPGIVTALIFTFIGAWNELLVALTLTSGAGAPNSDVPLTVSINNYIGQYSIDWGHLFAASVIATIPVIVLFAVIEKKVVGGLTAGSVK